MLTAEYFAVTIDRETIGHPGKEIADMARAFDMEVLPHVSIAMGPQLAAALHFAAAAGCRWCEYNPKVVEMANRFLKEPVRLEGAEYLIPQGPGLGVELTGGVF
mgnify:CR=1 FL=1